MQRNVMQCTHICTSMYVCRYADMQICKTRQDKTQDAAGISKPDHKKKKKKNQSKHKTSTRPHNQTNRQIKMRIDNCNETKRSQTQGRGSILLPLILHQLQHKLPPVILRMLHTYLNRMSHHRSRRTDHQPTTQTCSRHSHSHSLSRTRQ